MNRDRCLCLLLTLVLTCCMLQGYSRKSVTSLDEAVEAIVFRRIGHELLQAAGDSVSRVLPVQRIADNEYQISFENTFAFEPDSLVQIVTRCLAASTLPSNYVVNVLDCGTRELVYGYASGFTAAGNSPACRGRKQPVSCYRIRILFEEPVNTGNKGIIWGAGASVLALTGLGFWWGRQRRLQIRKPEDSVAAPVEMAVAIGRYLFYPEQQLLVWETEQIALTTKETKLLTLFTRHINELISREQLQKEGWEDEGVITGRSLDMYVSKLRRHLQRDASVKLVNIHGRGYKIDVNCQE